MPISSSTFTNSVDKFVQEVSQGDSANLFKAVPSLIQARRCESFRLVRKRVESHFFYTTVDFVPSEHSLSDVVKKGFEEVETKKKKIGSFTFKYTLDAKGNVSVSLIDAGIAISGDGHNVLTMQLGEVMEEDIRIPDLAKIAKNRKFDMDNDFIRQVVEKKETLCLIVKSYKTNNDAIIRKHVQEGVSTQANVPVDGVEIGLGGAMMHAKDGFVGIPAGTILAYELREILVSPDGSFRLQIPGNDGGFLEKDEDEAASEDSNGIRKLVKPILTLQKSELNNVRTSLKKLLKQPEVLSSLKITFREALQSLIVEECVSEMTEQELKEELGSDDLKYIKPLLQIAGFSLQDDKVIYPKSDESKTLYCTSKLLDILDTLNDDQKELIHADTYMEEQKQSIMMLIEKMVATGSVCLDEPTVSDLFSKSKLAETRLLIPSFQLEKQDGKRCLSYRRSDKPTDKYQTPVDRLIWMYVLWG